jgi:hypothetical protein
LIAIGNFLPVTPVWKDASIIYRLSKGDTMNSFFPKRLSTVLLIAAMLLLGVVVAGCASESSSTPDSHHAATDNSMRELPSAQY